MNEEKIKKMKCKELISELRLIKKPIYGVKAVLVERLLNYNYNVNDSEAIGLLAIS